MSPFLSSPETTQCMLMLFLPQHNGRANCRQSINSRLAGLTVYWYEGENDACITGLLISRELAQKQKWLRLPLAVFDKKGFR